jgi:uncharacterized alkaline shock family protein YloU
MAKKTLEHRFHEEEMKPKLEEMEKGGDYLVAGQTDIADAVIGAIAATAAREVDGVGEVGPGTVRRILSQRLMGAQKKSHGATVQAGKKEAIVDLTVTVIYGFNVPQLVVDVRKKVGARLLEIAGLIAKEVNIRVVGIDFPARMPGRVE